jgi:recombination protein RecT
MAKKETDNGMFAQAETTPATAPATEVKKTTAPAIPSALRELAPFLTKPKQAFCAAGGTEQKFAQEVNFAMQAMLNNPYLVTCAKSDPDHLVEAIKNVGLTGLSLNPELRLGYLVPFKGKIKFMSSYMGKIDILIRTGVVKSIQAELVYEKDQFVYRKGVNATLEHTPDVFAKDRGELKGGYYIAVLANGQIQYDVMPVDRIEEIKNRSESVKNGKGSPWSTDYTEMAKKTIINWAFKSLPKTGISEDMIRAIEADNEIEREDFEDWKKAQEIKQADSFKDDGKFAEYEEVSAN